MVSTSQAVVETEAAGLWATSKAVAATEAAALLTPDAPATLLPGYQENEMSAL